MAYVIGVSTGLWGVAQGEEKEQYMTMMKKIFWGGFKGVDFSQVDIDTVNEFNEPYLKESIDRVKSLGMSFGFHAETSATVREHTMPLDSAIFDDYERAHKRLIQHIKGSGDVGAKYLLTHASELTPIILVATQNQTSTKLADFWGRPFEILLEENEWLLDWGVEQPFVNEIRRVTYASQLSREDWEEEAKKLNKKIEELTKDDVEKIKKGAEKEGIKRYVSMRDLDFGSERVAYFFVARWMQVTNDPLWVSMVGKAFDFNNDTYRQYEKWVPAVTAKYLWGHFNPLPMERLKGKKKNGESWSVGPFVDPKPLLEKYNLIFVFEPQMASLGFEEHMRLHKITDIYWLAKHIGSKKVGVAFDIEHTLSGGWDPFDLINKLPPDGGHMIKVMHVGWPTPHVPAHIPIYLGSEAQEYIYKILYELKKKGFDEKEDRWIIFERGGGQDPIKDSVISLRKIVEFLRKDIAPKDLPAEFYGVGEDGPEVARQFVTVREHALDPLKGVLHVPEEEFGFLSTGVAQKGKIEEWKKEKFR